MTEIAAIDWSRGNLDLVYLVEVEYHDGVGSGVARWCGPRSRTRGGVRLQVEQPTGTKGVVLWHSWEGRLDGLTVDESLGAPSQTVQTLSDVSMRVQMVPSDPLWTAVRDGYWRGQPLRVWVWDRTQDRVQPLAVGRVDRDPTRITAEGFDLVATVGPLHLEDEVPHTTIPDSVADSGWTHLDAATAAGSPHILHPGYVAFGAGFSSYAIPEWARGTKTGVVYGEDVYREVVFYGWHPSYLGGSATLFFHVSPQMDCRVDDLWFLAEDGSLERVSTTPSPHYVVSFNNLDPACGPVGSCCAVVGIDDSYYALLATGTTVFAGPGDGREESRAYARIQGPVHPAGIMPFVGGTWFDGARQRVTGTGTPATYDHEVLRVLFDVDLGSTIGWTVPAPISLAVGPSGPHGSNWMTCRGAAPKRLDGTVPTLRQLLGDLLLGVQADIAHRLDPAAMRMRLWVARRRPWSLFVEDAQTDFVIRRADLVSGHPGAVPGWRIDDDPGGAYATRVDVAHEFVAEPVEDVSGVHLGDARTIQYPHRDISLESVVPAKIGRRATRGYLRPNNDNGWADSSELIGALSSQRQTVSTVELGAHRYGIGLTDTLRYDGIDGLPASTGQVRRRTLDLDRQTVRLTVWHLEFCRWTSTPIGT